MDTFIRYVNIALFPSLNLKDHPATKDLEIDYTLFLKLADLDREISTVNGLILFGFDTALIPLGPPGACNAKKNEESAEKRPSNGVSSFRN